MILIVLLITTGCISNTQNTQRASLKTAIDKATYIESTPGKTAKDPLAVVLSFDYEDLGTDIGTKNLPTIFQILEKHEASATFFVMGKAADENPEAVKEIYSRGYSLGLHSSVHHFPIFSREDALIIEEVYSTTPDYVWDRSFKTPDAFYEDLEKNKRSIRTAVEDGIELKMFRSPSLVVNWTRDPVYFSTLKDAGVEIDSSVFREPSDKDPFYTIDDVVEVPVTVSEISLSDIASLNKIAESYSSGRIPFVMYIHPQKLSTVEIDTLDEFLSLLEEEYTVSYLKVDEVPTYYETP